MVGSFKNVGKKPKPFQRPGIDLDRVKRSWQTVPVRWLNEGDIVQDRGLIVHIASGDTVHEGVERTTREITFQSGERITYLCNTEVFAFSEIFTPSS